MKRTRLTSLFLLLLCLSVLAPAMAQEEGDGFTPATGSQTTTTAAAVNSTAVTAPAATSSSASSGDLSAGINKFFESLNRFFEAFSKLLAGLFGGGSTTPSTGGTTDTATTSTGTSTGTGTTASGSTAVAAGGALQQRIIAEAARLANRPFSYAAGTNGGRKGCAQVVTTALKAAGAVNNIRLGVLDALSDLRAQGWRETQAPPFQAGDVITWKTYDRNGDGVRDPDTHIGIIMGNGNSVQAMSNSSSALRPRYNSPYYAPISRVMRKVA